VTASLAAYSRSGDTSGRTKLIERTSHAATALIEDMRKDHRRAHITMTEQLLDGPDAVPSLP